MPARRLPRIRPRWLAALAVALCGASPSPAAATPVGADAKRVCAYTAHSVSALEDFGRRAHRAMDCALVYNDASTTWAGWENPWFIHHADPDLNWASWATAPGTDRLLISTQNLFPASLNHTDWLHAGARGEYTDHARALARNMVAAGLGDAVIRLGHEANGTWYPDSVGDTQAEQELWRQFWRRTVLAMRSVEGADFRFDWTVNAVVRPIPLADYYPGDDVVDIVGVDAYDSGIRGDVTVRWPVVWGRALGLGDVAAFATAHDKPLSIPEWGVGPTSLSQAGGDDAAYVDGIADVVRTHRVAYESYFSKYGWATQLQDGPLSRAAYVRHFGAGGDAGPPAERRRSVSGARRGASHRAA